MCDSIKCHNNKSHDDFQGAITRQPIEGRRTQWFIQCMQQYEDMIIELNVSSEEKCLRFHAAGPATTNARPPNFVLVR